jgi:signal transduction histidine kinase
MMQKSSRWPLNVRFGLITLCCLVVPVGILLTYLNLSIGDSFRGSVLESMKLRRDFLQSWFDQESRLLGRLSDFIGRDMRLRLAASESSASEPAQDDWWQNLASISGASFLYWPEDRSPRILGVADNTGRAVAGDVQDWWRDTTLPRLAVVGGKVYRFQTMPLPPDLRTGRRDSLLLVRLLDLSGLPWLHDQSGAGITIIDMASRQAVFSTFPDILAHQMVATWLSATTGGPADDQHMHTNRWQGQGYNSLGFAMEWVSRSHLLCVIAAPDRFNPMVDITKPILIVAGLIILMIALFGYLMTRIVIGPILSLSYAVESLRLHLRQHSPLVTIPVRRNDEIGDLAKAINELGQELGLSSEKISEQRSEIIAYTHSLEDRVQERTRELEDARLRAEIANQHKSKFLVNLNHELRTPLNAISGITDLLRYGAYEKHQEVAALLDQICRLLEAAGELPPDVVRSLRIAADSLSDDSGGKRTILEVLRFRLETMATPSVAEARGLLDEAMSLVDEEDRQFMKAYNNIHEAGGSLLTLIDEVINLSRIESGVIIIEPTRIRLADLVSSCMVHAEAYAQYHGKLNAFDITRTIAPEVPEWVCLDSQKVKQVLLNLLTNAVKYTDRGQVHLHLSLQVEGSDTMLLCSVQDTGRGISDKDRPVMFMEFGRSFEVREIEGTGLGLALSKKLIERHGGAMGYTSELGRGSTFWFTVPLVV